MRAAGGDQNALDYYLFVVLREGVFLILRCSLKEEAELAQYQKIRSRNGKQLIVSQVCCKGLH